MLTSIIRRTIIPGRAYAALDIDNPGAATLAVAWKGNAGWFVGVSDGRVIAEGLTQTRALHAMERVAADERNTSVARAILAEARR